MSFKTKIIRGKITSFEIKLSTTSGGGGVTATREGDVPSPGTANIDVEGIKATPLTQIIILVMGSPLRFYASATQGGVPGPGVGAGGLVCPCPSNNPFSSSTTVSAPVVFVPCASLAIA